jgi:hypothetical protein
MKFSAKAVATGLVTLLIITMALSLLESYYLPKIYNSVASAEQKGSMQDLSNKFMFHPLNIAYIVISTILGFGVPGYFAAAIANKSFVLHGFSVGLLGGFVFMLFDYQRFITAPWLSITGLLVSMLVAAMAGKVRELQLRVDQPR